MDPHVGLEEEAVGAAVVERCDGVEEGDVILAEELYRATSAYLS